MPEKLTLKEMHKIAEERGGKCLSKRYINTSTHLIWKCAKGHTWPATYSNIKGSPNRKATWCNTCGGTKKLTIEEMHKIAKERGGKCLSNKYVDNRTDMKWQCSKGHIWFKNAMSIKGTKDKKGTWCVDCKNISNFKELQKIAKERGGILLSKTITSMTEKVDWKCSRDHIWPATPSKIKGTKNIKGTWCRTCAGNEKLTLEDMHKIAKERGGKCLSKKYINTSTRLIWKCSEGHSWPASYDTIKGTKNRRGNWCPDCHIYYSEELCRTTFEQLFNKPFKRYKPSWLVNDRGNQMEIDGYCNIFKIGFEYNGIQHYEVNSYFKNENLLKQRRKDDEKKLYLCKKNNINLLVISYKDNLLDLSNLIKSKLTNNIAHKINFNKFIDFNRVYKHRNYLRELQNLAKERGGKLLSKKYVNARTNLEWQCAERHVWEATSGSVKSSLNRKGSWCETCYHESKKLKITDIKQFAIDRGGKCIDNKYLGEGTKVNWICKNNHVWEASYRTVLGRERKKLDWCSDCHKLTLTN